MALRVASSSIKCAPRFTGYTTSAPSVRDPIVSIEGIRAIENVGIARIDSALSKSDLLFMK